MNFIKRLLKYTAIVLCGVLLGLAVCAGVQWFWEGVQAGDVGNLWVIGLIIVCLIVGLSIVEE